MTLFKIEALDNLVELLSRLPGLGEKSAQRLAFYILKSKHGLAPQLAEALTRVQNEVKTCQLCYNYTDQDLCNICRDTQRPEDTLCVVETPADILRLEASGSYQGRYHVIQGVLSPLDGIGPEQLRIAELVNRLEQGNFSELILALDADLEGDATALYLSKILKPKGIRISRIAHGVPIGSNLEYVDHRTLGRALENRIEL